MANKRFLSGDFTVSGIITANGQLIGKGTSTNDNAAAGYIGEYTSSFINSGSAITLTNNQFSDVTSISLTAGDWDVSSVSLFTESVVGTVTSIFFGVSDVSGNAIGGTKGDSYVISSAIPNASGDSGGSVANWRVSITTTTPIYLKARVNALSGTYLAYGRISARRVR